MLEVFDGLGRWLFCYGFGVHMLAPSDTSMLRGELVNNHFAIFQK
jgi:hypothetical protein